jgi:hypothetical protein
MNLRECFRRLGLSRRDVRLLRYILCRIHSEHFRKILDRLVKFEITEIATILHAACMLWQNDMQHFLELLQEERAYQCTIVIKFAHSCEDETCIRCRINKLIAQGR